MNLKETAIGIELGSTRIKAVMIGRNHEVLAQGDHTWENSFINGVWTYSLEEVRTGLQDCFAWLKKDVLNRYGTELTTTGAIGVSAMMHGYLPFDKDNRQLCEFRTWRNTITQEAAEKLSGLFDFNIPQRWSIAHLYQAILNKEEHVKDIACITTLAGYVHFVLTGERFMGIGEASGMFPIDSGKLCYDEEMVRKFNECTGLDLLSMLPGIKPAGEPAGVLTQDGALYLDPSGKFEAGIPVAPCEGDAGTGMVATDSVRVRTGNVSAGTSDFAMVVTDKKLKMHREIDMVTTPAGKPVAMVHCNNCTSDINAWVKLVRESLNEFGFTVDTNTLYTKLFEAALKGDDDCGGLLSYNYFSGEGVTDLNEGRLLFMRKADARFTLANFMRTHLYSAMATLKIGMDILRGEDVVIDKIYGHGGFFKTPEVGQRILSAAIGTPVSVMETAGEGGPYGMALLCAYMIWKEDESLEDYLDDKVFHGCKAVSVMAEQKEVDGFNKFIEDYKSCLKVEQEAIKCWKN
ncbi:MAG: FGGY-family carbohydrate kinase [Eubacteriales bacterium]|nr:FGGY-family carbohydrate kinase [Eubacteriales bacterium]